MTLDTKRQIHVEEKAFCFKTCQPFVLRIQIQFLFLAAFSFFSFILQPDGFWHKSEVDLLN